MSKSKRKGKVFIDWSQNSEHKSTVAVYSLRARLNGPFVAMPMTWDELKRTAKKADARGLFFEPASRSQESQKDRRSVRPFVEAQAKTTQAIFGSDGDFRRVEGARNLSAETGLHENA